MKQMRLLKDEPKAYGGELLKTRKGRQSGRPLDTRHSMHLVLRSSKARGEWSFLRPYHKRRIEEIVGRFSKKFGVRILSLANVGNHLHFHIQLTSRHTYNPFIRATTAAIAMAITKASRWRPLKKTSRDRFWDYRPFTRVVMGFRALLTLRDYLQINHLESAGITRVEARWIIHSRGSYALRV